MEFAMPSRRNSRKKGCKSKRKYETKTMAVAAMRFGKKKGFLSRQHWTYQCENCGGWHIGRRPERYLN